ncbi:MAG: zinc-dependent alcohol dehydrogenase family protein [Betaproteobacteria bacterium]|nr:zinc-dependent alcohol dehydrogenase family protein [Betaproteobacteria bacterium]
MHAMRLHAPCSALARETLALPVPSARQLLLKVRACGVCRTDLHVVDGELPRPKLPLVPGHEIVGEVIARGRDAARFREGERVGVPWLGGTCGRCEFCRSGRENLCDEARFTGYDLDGGYAEYALADEQFCFTVPERYADQEAAPLLCAGLIGYRSLAMAGNAPRLGIYGFGAAAHIVAQLAKHEGRQVFAFTRPGDTSARQFARRHGADWAGDSGTAPPELLDAAILFAPAGELVPESLARVRKGGIVVCGGIHMSDIPSFPYALLWGERRIRSVANLTRADGEQFMRIAAQVPLRTETTPFALEKANEALAALRAGTLSGAAVLVP